MAVRVKKKGTQLRGAGVMNLVAEFVQVRKMRVMWSDKEDKLKAQLASIVDARGEPDDKGSLWYELPEEVDGVTKLYKQKRVTQALNETVAEVHLKKLDLWDQCTQEVVVIDEDAVLALGFKKEIPADVMQEIFEERVNYAFYLK